MSELVAAAERAPKPMEMFVDDSLEEAAMAGIDDDDDLHLPVAMQMQCENEDALVQEHWGLVRTIAWRYRERGMSLGELRQEGGIGLVLALRSHDPERGALSTHATNLIHRSIIAALERQSRAIRLPQKVYRGIRSLNKAQGRLWAVLGRAPDTAELAAEAKIVPEQIAELRKAENTVPESLDKPLPSGGVFIPDQRTETLADIIPGMDEEDLIRIVTHRGLCRQLDVALRVLNEREESTVRARYGLRPYVGEHSLDEIAEMQESTAGAVSSVLRRAMRKLRSPDIWEDPR